MIDFSALFCAGDFPWILTEFIIGVFLQVLGLPFVAVAQVSLFSKVTAEKTQGEDGKCPAWIRLTQASWIRATIPKMHFMSKKLSRIHLQVSVRECDALWEDWPPSWVLSGPEA